MKKRLTSGCDKLHTKNLIGYEVHTLDKMIKRSIEMQIETEDLPRMQSWIISFLFEHPADDIFQRDIEAKFRIPRSTATGILQSMEKSGFLIRESVPDDARLKRLVLTEKGIERKLAIMKSMDQMEQILRKDIPDEKLQVFFEVARLIGKNIENNIL